MAKLQHLRNQFLEDLANQTLPHTPLLPTSKEIASFYNISQPTVRKLLSELVDTGQLEREGARYRIPKSSNSNPMKGYVQIVMGANDNGIRMETPREIDFFRNILHQVSSMHLDLRVIGVEDWRKHLTWRRENGQSDPSLNPTLTQQGLVGTILSTWHIKDARHILTLLLQTNTKTPVAVWMEESGVEQWIQRTQGLQHKRHVCYFDVAYGKAPGIIVAKFLKENQLQRVAYFSPFHKATWSIDRYQAILAEQQKWGGTLDPYTSAEAVSPWDFRHAVEHRPAVEKAKSALRQSLLQGDIAERMISDLENQVTEAFRNQFILRTMQVLFERALREKYQAWVCANDLVALLALDYFLEREIPKRKQPHLVGFDNIPETFTAGISSLECGTMDLAQSMIEFLLRPGLPAYARRHVIRIPGHMYSRGSHLKV